MVTILENNVCTLKLFDNSSVTTHVINMYNKNKKIPVIGGS